MIDLNNIYIKEGVTNGKIPARILANSLAIGSASHRRSWGTWSHKNLIKAHLVCRSVRTMYWTVKKIFAHLKVMCDEHGVTIMTSKSSFLFEELERRISKGYCRGDRPKNAYLYIYWARDPI